MFDEKVSKYLKKESKYLRVDGLRSIITSRYLMFKLAWFGLVTSSTCLCSYFIYESIIVFLKYEVITTTRFVEETNAIFPTVTVCIYNAFFTTYALQLLYMSKAQDIYQLETFWKNRTGRYLSREEKLKMGNLEAALISCTFQGSPCNATEFEFVEHYALYLNCYRFNSGYDLNGNKVPLKTVKPFSTGLDNSLTMEIYAGQPLTLKSNPWRSIDVFVDYTDSFHYNSKRKKIMISPGAGANVVVKRFYNSQFNQWPYKYSECTVNADKTLIRPLADRSLFDKSIAINSSYSIETCLYVCTHQAIVQECNCTYYLLGDYGEGGSEYCLSVAQQACVYSVELKIANTNWLSVNCLNKCPLECNQKYLNFYTSSYKYPPNDKYVSQVLSKNPMLIKNYANYYDFKYDLANNVNKFSVYYESLDYVIMEETAKYTLENLIAKIGGHLHVFLGMSVMSFVDLFDIFALALFQSLRKH